MAHRVTFAKWETPSNRYHVHIALCPEEEGGYCVMALNLPGAISQGDTRDEAIQMIIEAVQGVGESYIVEDKPIPWTNDYEIPRGSEERWITVDIARPTT